MSPTSFSHYSRQASSLLLSVLVAAIALCLTITLTTQPPPPRPGEGDIALYKSIEYRVRAGEPYYSAAGDEMRLRNYGLRSVLNWRPPALTRFIASLPSERFAKIILILLSTVILLWTLRIQKQQGGTLIAGAIALTLAGSLMISTAGDAFYFSELWAGTLLLAAILSHGANLPLLAAITALVALFLRELAGPFVLILAAYSLPKIRPLILLTLGLIAYALYFSYHIHAVHTQITPTDQAYPTGWLQFGGLPFLLSLTRQNVWLILTPPWLASLYLPIAILGLFAWPSPAGRLAQTTTLFYLAFFSIIGKPFNDYWGLLISPLLAISFVWGLVSLRDLILILTKTPTAQTDCSTPASNPPPATDPAASHKPF